MQKNDSEKMLLQLQRVQQQPEENVQHHQSNFARIENLEAVVKQQEKVNIVSGMFCVGNE